MAATAKLNPRTNRLSSPACQPIMTLIMQNKPNLPDAQMNVSLAITRNYNNEQRTMNYELLFKTNPNKPNFQEFRISKIQIPFFNTCLFPVPSQSVLVRVLVSVSPCPGYALPFWVGDGEFR